MSTEDHLGSLVKNLTTVFNTSQGILGQALEQDAVSGTTSDINATLARVPLNTIASIHDLCQNQHVPQLLGVMWGALIGSVVAAYLLQRIAVRRNWVHCRANSEARLRQFSRQVPLHVWSTIAAGLYWYDIYTDLSVVKDVWPHWPAFTLLALFALSYVVSGCTVCTYLSRGRRHEEVSAIWVFGLVATVLLMPYLDTIAGVQLVLLAINVSAVKIDLMEVNEYQHMRRVVKAVFASLGTATVTSVVYAMGNKPREGLVLTKWKFVLSLAASLTTVLTTWCGALYKSAEDGVGVFQHLTDVLVGKTLSVSPFAVDEVPVEDRIGPIRRNVSVIVDPYSTFASSYVNMKFEKYEESY